VFGQKAQDERTFLAGFEIEKTEAAAAKAERAAAVWKKARAKRQKELGSRGDRMALWLAAVPVIGTLLSAIRQRT
jgi:hypothetical protein